jgi:sodium-dependent dicarboxylate transporter 2/3/5
MPRGEKVGGKIMSGTDNGDSARFFDIKGVQTGQPVTGGRGACLAGSFVIFVICYFLPIGGISPTASRALALVLTVIWIWVTNCVPLAVGCLILAVGGLFLKLFTFGEFAASFGSSPFVPMIGLLTVSLGAGKTNIAKRVAYIFLSSMGRSPALILLAISVATAVVSAFVSNLGTTIVMSSISIAIMTEMGEEKGSSGLGKAIMLAIPMFSMIGGLALISGSPSTNMMGISMLENSTGKAFTVTYSQWAKIGIPSALILLAPSWAIYAKAFGVRSRSDKKVDVELFRGKLRELGPLRGAELRWIIIVAFMVITMVAGVLNMAMAALLCGTLVLLPVIGCVEPNDAIKSLPMDVLILIGFSPIIANIINNSKLGEWAVNNLFGWAPSLPGYVLMLTMTLVMTVMTNVCANATIGIIAVCVAALTPLALAGGMNPSIALLPAMFMGSATTVLGVQTNVVLTYHYGYWDMKDTLKPGIAVAVLWSAVTTTVAYFLGPVVGMPLYL